MNKLTTVIKMKYFLVLLFVNGLIAELTDSDCGVAPISSWAGEASKRNDTLPEPVALVILSHTATKPCSTDAECEKQLKTMRTYFMSMMGYTDIAHSFYIGGNGKVYEGAGWHHVGAHTRHYNTKSIGISFIGDFRDSLPTLEALQAAQDLLPCGVKHHHLSADYQLVGHKQLSATQSPGAALQAHIIGWPHWSDIGDQLL